MLALAVLPIVLIALGALLLVLFLGGLVANARRRAVLRERLRKELEAADAALATARAQDRGWDRAIMESVARTAIEERHAAAAIHALHLVQVVDRPGTDEDQAVFRVQLADGRQESLTLGRRDGRWVAV